MQSVTRYRRLQFPHMSRLISGYDSDGCISINGPEQHTLAPVNECSFYIDALELYSSNQETALMMKGPIFKDANVWDNSRFSVLGILPPLMHSEDLRGTFDIQITKDEAIAIVHLITPDPGMLLPKISIEETDRRRATLDDFSFNIDQDIVKRNKILDAKLIAYQLHTVVDEAVTSSIDATIKCGQYSLPLHPCEINDKQCSLTYRVNDKPLIGLPFYPEYICNLEAQNEKIITLNFNPNLPKLA